MLTRYYKKEELEKLKTDELRQVAKQANLKYISKYKKEELIPLILDEEKELINLGVLKVQDEQNIKKQVESCENIKTSDNKPQNGQNNHSSKKQEKKIDNKLQNEKQETYKKAKKQNKQNKQEQETGEPVEEKQETSIKYINKDTGEVLTSLPEKATIVSSDKDEIIFVLKESTETKKKENIKNEQLKLNIPAPEKEKSEKDASVQKGLSDEERLAQREEAMRKYRKENGCTFINADGTREEIGGEGLTKILIVLVPIAFLVGLYTGFEVITTISSKLWYGDLAYVPSNMVGKTIVCIFCIMLIWFSKSTQKLNKVIDFYLKKIKTKDNNSANDNQNEK